MATLTSSGACFAKAGKNVSQDLISGAALFGFINPGAVVEEYILQAESQIQLQTRKDWVSGAEALEPKNSKLLDKVASAIVGMDMINYDMSGYTNRTEAEIMLDKLNNEVQVGISTLRDIKTQTFTGI